MAKAKGVSVEDITVCVLDRPRHEQTVKDIRAAGARVKLISDGDVAGAVMAAAENTGVDLLLGIGGTPEGIIAACAVTCLGGVILGRLWPRDDAERPSASTPGTTSPASSPPRDLVDSDNVFFVATGITDGELVHGVRYARGGSATTESLVMRSRSGTIRRVQSTHRLSKLQGVLGGAVLALRHKQQRPPDRSPSRWCPVSRISLRPRASLES